MSILQKTYTPEELMELKANLTAPDLDILAQAAHRGRPMTVEFAIGILRHIIKPAWLGARL